MNNNIKESYCSFEVSKLLKEKGFLILKENEHPKFYYEDFEKITSYHIDLWEKYGRNEYKDLPIVQKITHALAIEWISVNFGIITWVSPHPLSSSGGWSYNIIQYAAGVLKAYVIEKASSVSLSRQEATEEVLLYALKHLI